MRRSFADDAPVKSKTVLLPVKSQMGLKVPDL